MMRSDFEYTLKRLNRSLRARLALALPRWTLLPAQPTPLNQLAYPGAEPTRDLVIFLTGIDDLAEDFERRGFIAALREAGVSADVLALDAHYGYYAARVIHDRLAEDVILPARASGYENIWLAGISLGGFGAASYAARHPSHASGLILFAPYLGGEALVAEIAAAGGLRRWHPGTVHEQDYQRALWRWFKQQLVEGDHALPIHLGYGQRDIFARANGLLADMLPEGRVCAIPGGHDWRTWHSVWRRFLADPAASAGLRPGARGTA